MNDKRTLYDWIEEGFFDDVEFGDEWWVGDKFDLKRLADRWTLFANRPYAFKYSLIYRNIMPTWGVSSEYKDREKSEQVYKECLERGITWQERIGYKEPDEDQLL